MSASSSDDTEPSLTAHLRSTVAYAAASKGRVVTLEMGYTDPKTGRRGLVQHPVYLDVLEVTSPMIYKMATLGMKESLEAEKTGLLRLAVPVEGRENPVPRTLLDVSTFLDMLGGRHIEVQFLPWSSQLLLRYLSDMYSVPVERLALFSIEHPGTVPHRTEDILTFLLVEQQGVSFVYDRDRILHLQHIDWEWVADRNPSTQGDFLSLPAKLQQPQYNTLPAPTRLALLRRWGRALALASAPHFTGVTDLLLVDLHAQPFGNRVLHVLPPEHAKNFACDRYVSDLSKERAVGSPAFCDTAEQAIAALVKEWTVVGALVDYGLLFPGGPVVVSGGAVLRSLGVLSPDLPRSDLDLFVTPGDYRAIAGQVVGIVAEHYRGGSPTPVCKVWIRGAVVYVEVAPARFDPDERAWVGTGEILQIQIIAYAHPNPILGFDWDCCAVQFDGRRFQTTYPGLVSLLTREAGRFNAKQVPHLDRALKMFDRGFGVPLHALLTDTGLLLPCRGVKVGQKRQREEVSQDNLDRLMDEALQLPSFLDAVLASARLAAEREARDREEDCFVLTDDPKRLLDATRDVNVACARMQALDICSSDCQYRLPDKDPEHEEAPFLFASAQAVDNVSTSGYFRCGAQRVQVAFTFDTVRCTCHRGYNRYAFKLEIHLPDTPLGLKHLADNQHLDGFCPEDKKLCRSETRSMKAHRRLVVPVEDVSNGTAVDGITMRTISQHTIPHKFTGTVTFVRAGPLSVHIARIAVFPQEMRRKQTVGSTDSASSHSPSPASD